MKSIVIFGATSAIATACARLFAAESASLFLVARSQEKLSVLADDLKARGAAGVHVCVADLDLASEHQSIFNRAIAELGTIDLVLVAYGSLGDQRKAERSYETTESILRTNFFSVVSLLTIVSDHFESKRHGKIAVITSVAGDRGRQSNYIYGTAKGALNVFLEGLRNRLYPAGVQVLTIKPGFVDTPMTAHLPKGPLFASPTTVARDIKWALQWNLNTLYTPWFWFPIMLIIKNIPEVIFKRLKL